MKKIIQYLLLFSSVSVTTGKSIFAQINTATVPVIDLKGDAYNRGLQHGVVLKEPIAEVFGKWKKNILAVTKQHPDTVLNNFLSSTGFTSIIKKHTSPLLDEIKGIAAGSGQSYMDVYAFQLVDEFWVYLDKQYHSTIHHCSSIGVAATAGSPAYIAQNIDLENYMQGYQVLLHLLPNDKEPEQYIVTCAGLVALGGMNEKGIGLCMNSVMELQASEDGLPVAFMVRGVLAKQNGTDALQFLQKTKHASGQNYILGIADSVYDFEASANEVVRFIPAGSDGEIVYHSNHALVNHDVKEWYKEYHQQVLTGKTINSNSEIRYASLQQRMTFSGKKISQQHIKETLRSKDDADNPVCRTYRERGGGFTFSSVIYTLTGKRSVQLTYGSPDQAEYREYFFGIAK